MTPLHRLAETKGNMQKTAKTAQQCVCVQSTWPIYFQSNTTSKQCTAKQSFLRWNETRVKKKNKSIHFYPDVQLVWTWPRFTSPSLQEDCVQNSTIFSTWRSVTLLNPRSGITPPSHKHDPRRLLHSGGVASNPLVLKSHSRISSARLLLHLSDRTGGRRKRKRNQCHKYHLNKRE